MSDVAAEPSIVGSFLRRYRDDIVAEWTRVVLAIPDERELHPHALIDHIPEVVDEIANLTDDLTRGPGEVESARQHGITRMCEGFEITTVVTELSVLRGAILTLWARENVGGSIAELSALNLAIDRAVIASVASYAERQRQELAASDERSRQAAADREHALAKLEALLAASPVGIGFIDTDLRVVRINESLSAFSGLPARANYGRKVTDVYPDLADKLEPILRHVLSTGEPALNVEVTRYLPTNPADRRSLLATYFPVRSEAGAITGVGGVLVDVTTAKRAQDALRSEQLQLESIIEHAPASIVIKDATGRIILANQRVASALGHTVAEIIGRRTSDLLPPEIAIPHEQHDRTVLTEQRAVEVEEEFPSAEGLRTFLTIKFPIPGDLIGGIATEITERKRMEEELRVALRIREELLAVVSHDLRSPLGTIQLSASLLIHQLDRDQRSQRHLDVIMRQCSRMAQLINDLLDSAKIRAGRLQLDMRREDASSVVAEALDLLRSLADEKGVELVLDCDLEGVDVACDRGRILQVFANLIGNGIKFCRAGDTITLAAERRDEAVQFSVADTGPGIEAAALPRLFEAYWSGAEHENDGAGLGLFIVRGIIERHGGRIWVESRPGAGAKFLFTIPIAH